MKAIKIVFPAVLLAGLLLCQHACGQFVSLQGRQFKIDTTDFYPLVLNYGFDINRNATEFFMVPNRWSGPTKTSHDCDGDSACQARIRAQLQQVADMGFNAVRLCTSARYRRDALGQRHWAFEYFHTPSGTARWADFSSNNVADTADTNARVFLKMTKDFLDMADSAGLKVILIAGDDGANWKSPRAMYMSYDEEAVEDYEAYLLALSGALKDYECILGYDLTNEPQLTGLGYRQANSNNRWSKEEICQFSKRWYNAVKAGAPHHLVTIGGHGFGDMETWDPAILTVDYYSLHHYPPTQDKTANLTDLFNRYKSEIYWFSKVYNRPWIIGETGFSACDDTTYAPLSDTNNHKLGKMDGSEAQQKAFVEMSLDAVRDFGGSGYSWWYFTDIGDEEVNSQTFYGNWYGLVKYNDPGSEVFREKLAVQAFRDYAFPARDLTKYVMPDNYYDVKRVGDSNGHFTGTVTDQLGRGIENARIFFHYKYEDKTSQTVNTTNETFTDSMGNFDVRIIDTLNPENVNIRYPGADFLNYGRFGTDGATIPADRQFTLHIAEYVTATSLSNVVLSSADPVVYKASQAITVDHVLAKSGTHSEWVSGTSVTWGPGFEVELGAEATAMVAPIVDDCYLPTPGPHITAPTGKNAEEFDSGVLGEENTRAITLKFSGELWCRASPNPTSGIFTLRLSHYPEKAVTFTITDQLGKPVYASVLSAATHTIDLSDVSPGIYQLRIELEGETLHHVIVKQ